MMYGMFEQNLRGTSSTVCDMNECKKSMQKNQCSALCFGMI